MNIKRLLKHIKEKNVTAKCLNWCHLEKITLISPSLSTCLFPPTDPLQKIKKSTPQCFIIPNRSTSVISLFITACQKTNKNKHHLNLSLFVTPHLFPFPLQIRGREWDKNQITKPSWCWRFAPFPHVLLCVFIDMSQTMLSHLS